MYGKMVQTSTRQPIRTVGKFVKHWAWLEITTEKDVLRSGNRNKQKLMSSTVTKVCTLPYVTEVFISNDEK